MTCKASQWQKQREQSDHRHDRAGQRRSSHFLFKRVDNCRDIVPDHSIVSAPVTLSQAIGIKCPADLGSGFLGDFHSDFRVQRVFQKDRFYLLLFYLVDEFSDMPIRRLGFRAHPFNGVHPESVIFCQVLEGVVRGYQLALVARKLGNFALRPLIEISEFR